MGRVTADVVRGRGVTQPIGVVHIAILSSFLLDIHQNYSCISRIFKHPPKYYTEIPYFESYLYE